MTEWNYCTLVQDARDGKIYMAYLIENRWQIVREIKELIDITPEREAIVS